MQKICEKTDIKITTFNIELKNEIFAQILLIEDVFVTFNSILNKALKYIA